MQSERFNLKRHPRCNFTILEELEFVDRYQSGESFEGIAEEVGVNRQTIWKIATDVYDVEPYQTRGYPGLYDINTDVFEDINNEKSMYALGLLATDGYARVDRNQIGFYSTDKEQVENLKKCLECTKEIRTRKPRDGEVRGRPIHGKKNVYVIYFGPERVYNGFLDYFSAKSRDINDVPSEIKDSEYSHHFVRGALDGDGCVSDGVYFTGHMGFIKDIQNIIIDGTNINETPLHKKTNWGSAYDLRIKGKVQLKRVYNWLYKPANYFLTRKKDKLEDYLK